MTTDITPVRFGKYLLLDPIAVGGMAELFRAKMTGDEGFEILVVVKRILPYLVGEKELVDAFVDEARLAAFLQHENVVRTYDFGRMGDDYFIAMEYLLGKNLRELLVRARMAGHWLSLENTLRIISKVCEGLDYAHSLADFKGKALGIVHRDVSPPNVFITYDGQVKVVDFGVAKAACQNSATQLGIIKGKVAYMSPEQADGRDIDHRSDIFAAGAVLYEMVTGKKAFAGDNMAVLAKVRNAEFAPPEKVVQYLPPKLCRIIQKAMARDPDKRYQSCGHMLTDLEDFAFELDFRPTGRGLARFMEKIFEQDRDHDLKSVRNVMQLKTGRVVAPKPDDLTDSYEITLASSSAAPGDEEREGEQAEDLKCPSCARPIEDGQAFCPWCGIDLFLAREATNPALEKDQALSAIRKRVGLFGGFASGKTSLVRRYVEDDFSGEYQATIGVAGDSKTLNFEGRKVVLSLRDFSGEDPCLPAPLEKARELSGYFLVLDGTRPPGLDVLERTQRRVEEMVGKRPFVCLINKADRLMEWKLRQKEIDALVKKGWTVMRTSAKTGLGVNKAFMTLTEMMMEG